MSDGSIIVFDPLPAVKEDSRMMGGPSVPVEAIRSGVQKLLLECREIFGESAKVLGPAKLVYVDVTLGISVDGSVGIFGSQLGGGAKGGITVRLSFEHGASTS